MEFKPYVVDRVLHWVTVLLLLLMINLSTQIHYMNWETKGPLLHRQEAVQFHASIGLIILVITLARVAFVRKWKSHIPRINVKNRFHAKLVSVVHASMYTCLFLLIASGLGLANNYEIPLVIYGVELTPIREDFLKVFPTLHEIHLQLQTIFWWLVIIHFFGYMYAKS